MYQKTLTKEQMEERGWEFGPPRSCSRCGQMIFWGRHPETGKNYSFDEGGTNYHFRHCGQPARKPGPGSGGDTASARRPASPTTPPASPEADLQVAIAELAVAVRALAKAMFDHAGNQRVIGPQGDAPGQGERRGNDVPRGTSVPR